MKKPKTTSFKEPPMTIRYVHILGTVVFFSTVSSFVILLSVYLNQRLQPILLLSNDYQLHHILNLPLPRRSASYFPPPPPPRRVGSYFPPPPLPLRGSSIDSNHQIISSNQVQFFPKGIDNLPTGTASNDSLTSLSSSPSPSPSSDVISDEELLRRAAMAAGGDEVKNGRRKVAFMFLTRWNLPLAPLWEVFFKGNEEFYSIYVHTSPEFKQEPPESSVFYGKRIPSKEVEWGGSSMMDAERRLLSHALLDSSNTRFLLLSETCIPLFNFTTIYNYLTRSTLSFLGSFDGPDRVERGRYNRKMYPHVSLSHWRKGNQWFEISRKIAVEIVSDQRYYAVFKSHCRPPCYIDEHYLPTLVNIVSPEMNSNRTVTWVDWSKGGSHPVMFVRKDIGVGFLNRIRFGFNCSYEGNVSNMCFLFARKFHVSTLQPLMNLAPYLYGI